MQFRTGSLTLTINIICILLSSVSRTFQDCWWVQLMCLYNSYLAFFVEMLEGMYLADLRAYNKNTALCAVNVWRDILMPVFFCIACPSTIYFIISLYLPVFICVHFSWSTRTTQSCFYSLFIKYFLQLSNDAVGNSEFTYNISDWMAFF